MPVRAGTHQLWVNCVGFKLTAQAFHHLPLPGEPDKVILFRHVQRGKMVGHRLLVVADNPGDVEPAQVRQIVLVRRIAHGDDGVDRRANRQFCDAF
nr:MAG TPA_asm: hypothetical protein [Caudoviricetes sp.]